MLPLIIRAPGTEITPYCCVEEDVPHRLKAVVNVSDQLLAPLLDQLVCSRARWLVLNVFSTFSQLTMGFIGLRASSAIGWVRDLSREAQLRAKVNVTFWRRAPEDDYV